MKKISYQGGLKQTPFTLKKLLTQLLRNMELRMVRTGKNKLLGYK